MRKAYWYITAYARKHGWVMVLSLVGAILIFSLLIPKVAQNLNFKQRQYIGLVGNYTLTNLPDVVAQKLSGGLTKIDDDGSPVAQLAERWSVSEDGTQYTFTLRDEIYWHDGKKLEPSDISYRFPDIQVETKENTIVYTLPAAYAPFPTITSDPLLRISENKKFGALSKNVYGIGATRLISYELDQNKLTQIILESDDTRYVYRVYPNEEDAVAAFKLGEVDTLEDLNDVYDIFAWEDLVEFSQSIDTRTYTAVFFNTADPRLAKNVRVALNYATSKPPQTIRAFGPISRDSWAYLSGLKSFSQDYDRAVERLLESIPPQEIALTLQTSGLLIDQAETLKSEWEELGNRATAACATSKDIADKNECSKLAISVSIQVSNFLDTQNFEAVLAPQVIPSDPDQYPLWHSEQPTNFTQFKDTRIDKLLEEGRQQTEQRRRLESYQEFQQFFVDESPAIFLSYLPHYSIRRK